MKAKYDQFLYSVAVFAAHVCIVHDMIANFYFALKKAVEMVQWLEESEVGL